MAIGEPRYGVDPYLEWVNREGMMSSSGPMPNGMGLPHGRGSPAGIRLRRR